MWYGLRCLCQPCAFNVASGCCEPPSSRRTCNWSLIDSVCIAAPQDFEKLWRKHEKSTTEEKDVIIFDLKFPVSEILAIPSPARWSDRQGLESVLQLSVIACGVHVNMAMQC